MLRLPDILSVEDITAVSGATRVPPVVQDASVSDRASAAYKAAKTR